MGSVAAQMELGALEADVAAGVVDTVVLAMPDVQGRLQGKRLDPRHFLEAALDHGVEACDYLLAVDVEMSTVDGYALTGWDVGYGDLVLAPDLATLRPLPWHPGSVICLADAHDRDGVPIAVAPREILRRQLARLAERGWSALVATELELMLFRDSYDEARSRDFRDLRPACEHNGDYSLLDAARAEPFMRRLRSSMAAAGLPVEGSKGECSAGQQELNFRYGDALSACDGHVIYKAGAKEIAAQAGMAVTFMAKFDDGPGNSCHIHLSLRADDDAPVFSREPDVLDGFLGGLLATLPDLTLLLAPNVNSYKRFRHGSFAPTSLTWGHDNRTCALRVVGHDASLRIECRVPGADVNPYVAAAALVAGGLHGVDAGLRPPPPTTGNGYAAAAERLPATLRDARERFAASDVAHRAFGTNVVEHWTNAARVELAAFDSSVTDWERRRGFERL
jgi:glutamine synthetase